MKINLIKVVAPLIVILLLTTRLSAFGFSHNDTTVSKYETACLEPSSTESQEINKAIRNANSIELSKFFNTTVEVVLPDYEGTYSKVQAQMILSTFFDKNPVKSYTVKQEGSSPNNTSFTIGTYISSNNKTYRVYFVTKKTGNRELIQHIEFDLM